MPLHVLCVFKYILHYFVSLQFYYVGMVYARNGQMSKSSINVFGVADMLWRSHVHMQRCVLWCHGVVTLV
jgi:hypothetical protein